MFQYVLLINRVRENSPKMVWDIHRLRNCPSGFSPDWSGEITFNSGFPLFWWHCHMLCWNKISQHSKKVWVGSGGFLRHFFMGMTRMQGNLWLIYLPSVTHNSQIEGQVLLVQQPFQKLPLADDHVFRHDPVKTISIQMIKMSDKGFNTS